MTRYTPPGSTTRESPIRRRPLYLRIGVVVLLIGVVSLVLGDLLFALL